MTDFLEEPQFPGCPSFGFISQPDFSVTIVQLAGGIERRNQLWSRPLHKFTCVVGPRLEEEIQILRDFWMAVGGQECGFRFKDYADFKSCFVSDTPTALDQPILADSDSTGFQLAKFYTAGIRTQVRLIQKPVAGTILIANELQQIQSESHWDLDEMTGIIYPNSNFIGAPTSWGGEFDVPTRFDSPFPVEVANRRIESVQLALMELRL